MKKREMDTDKILIQEFNKRIIINKKRVMLNKFGLI